MNARLLPCPSCLRHVRASEQSCPFCAAGVDFPDATPLKATWAETRLSRSARVALGAALAAALPGCGAGGGNAPVPVYGAPAPEGPPPEESMPLEPEQPTDPGDEEFATPPDGELSPGPDAGAMRPKYGAPPMPPDEGANRPKYGAPPPPGDPGTMKPLYGVPQAPRK